MKVFGMLLFMSVLSVANNGYQIQINIFHSGSKEEYSLLFHLPSYLINHIFLN